MIDYTHIAQINVVGVGNLHGNVALLSGDVSHGEIRMSLPRVRSAKSMFAAQSKHIFDDYVAIALAGRTMILHIQRIHGRLRVNLSYRNVVSAIADFHGAAVSA